MTRHRQLRQLGLAGDLPTVVGGGAEVRDVAAVCSCEPQRGRGGGQPVAARGQPPDAPRSEGSAKRPSGRQAQQVVRRRHAAQAGEGSHRIHAASLSHPEVTE
ncbi:hypothetical protein GCM10009623_28900 [Nocardioides aestuarii]